MFDGDSIHPAEKADAVHRRTTPFCNVKPANCGLPARGLVRFTVQEIKNLIASVGWMVCVIIFAEENLNALKKKTSLCGYLQGVRHVECESLNR